jgi:hypothetical protein
MSVFDFSAELSLTRRMFPGVAKRQLLSAKSPDGLGRYFGLG